MKTLKVAVAQYPVTHHLSFENWKAHVEKWVQEAAQEGAKLLVFPEYGALEMISMAPEKVQRRLDEQALWLSENLEKFLETYQDLAKKYQVMMCGPSIIVREEKKDFNRCYFFGSNGDFTFQDKQMLTRFENEKWKISNGDSQLTVIETPFAKIGICICFDGEFSEFAKLLCQSGVELLIIPSCTESMYGLERVHIGARARALENQCYVLVSQMVQGAHWSLVTHKAFGQSLVLAPPDLEFSETGILAKGELNKPGWIYSDLDFSKIESTRKDGSILTFQLKPPQNLICKSIKISFKI